MITLDASIVIAHLQPRDPHHQTAADYLREHAGETFLVHPLNLAEVLVGAVRVGRGQGLLADLRAMGIQTAETNEAEPLRLATLRAETRLKLPDCCALDTAMSSGSGLGTFDDDLARAARTLQVPVNP